MLVVVLKPRFSHSDTLHIGCNHTVGRVTNAWLLKSLTITKIVKYSNMLKTNVPRSANLEASTIWVELKRCANVVNHNHALYFLLWFY